MNEWKKVKIGDVCKIVKGTTGIAGAEPGKYPLVVTAVERKTCSTYQFDCEAVCIPLVSSSGHGKKSLNNVHYQSGKFALGTILCAVIPNNPEELDARYLHQYLQFYKDTVLVPLMKGAANVSLSMKDIAGVSIPLPPIQRQRELAGMFVMLQQKQKKLFAEFEKQTEYAKQLRQNILQEAIEGKLTADWRKQHPVQKGNPDYDAEALFEQIQKEKYHTDLFAPNGAHAKKAKSVSSEPIRVTKKEKSLPPITEDEIPFEIPTGWKWVRLGEICKSISDGDHLPPPKQPKGIPFVVISDVSSGYVNFKGDRFVSVEYYNQLSKDKKPEKDDILYTVTGSYGIPVFVNELKFCVQRHIGIIKPFSAIKKFLYYCLRSSSIKKQADSVAWGVAVKTIPIKELRQFILPLPPLAEQKEIVARVEAKLQTITQLETQIATRETSTKQLMQSILKDVFEKE